MDFVVNRMRTRLTAWAPKCALGLLAAALFVAAGFCSAAEDSAITALREKIDRAERDRMEICKVLGAIYEEMGETEKAIESYRMGFDVFPDDPLLCKKLIDLYTVKERWGDLVPVYRSLANANPGANQRYMTQLAECALKAGKHQEAIAVIEELLKEYAEIADDYRNAAQMLMPYEQYAAAADVCRKGITGKFGNSGDLHWILGRATGKLKKYDEAISAYKKAMELSGVEQDEKILQELAELLGEESVIEGILKDNPKALEGIAPGLGELYWRKALEQEKGGKPDAVMALCRKVLLVSPASEAGKAAEKEIQELSKP